MRLKELSQEIKDQSQCERDQQHGNDWDVDLSALALMTNVTRQSSKPIEPA